jgi:hypothetical protein
MSGGRRPCPAPWLPDIPSGECARLGNVSSNPAGGYGRRRGVGRRTGVGAPQIPKGPKRPGDKKRQAIRCRKVAVGLTPGEKAPQGTRHCRAPGKKSIGLRRSGWHRRSSPSPPEPPPIVIANERDVNHKFLVMTEFPKKRGRDPVKRCSAPGRAGHWLNQSQLSQTKQI